MTKNTMPEALQCAANLRMESESTSRGVKYSTAKRSAKELERLHAVEQEAQRLRAENEALKVDAARWKIVANHWSKANFKFDKQNNIAGMTLVIDVTKEGRSALLIAREFDSIIAARASTPQAS